MPDRAALNKIGILAMSFRKKLVLKNFVVSVISLEDINSPFLIPAADNFMTISLSHRCHYRYTAVCSAVQQGIGTIRWWSRQESIHCLFCTWYTFTGDGYTWIL